MGLNSMLMFRNTYCVLPTDIQQVWVIAYLSHDINASQNLFPPFKNGIHIF